MSRAGSSRRDNATRRPDRIRQTARPAETTDSTSRLPRPPIQALSACRRGASAGLPVSHVPGDSTARTRCSSGSDEPADCSWHEKLCRERCFVKSGGLSSLLMRPLMLVAALALVTTTPVAAEGDSSWREYSWPEQQFAVAFPGAPDVIRMPPDNEDSRISETVYQLRRS